MTITVYPSGYAKQTGDKYVGQFVKYESELLVLYNPKTQRYVVYDAWKMEGPETYENDYYDASVTKCITFKHGSHRSLET